MLGPGFRSFTPRLFDPVYLGRVKTCGKITTYFTVHRQEGETGRSSSGTQHQGCTASDKLCVHPFYFSQIPKLLKATLLPGSKLSNKSGCFFFGGGVGRVFNI